MNDCPTNLYCMVKFTMDFNHVCYTGYFSSLNKWHALAFLPPAHQLLVTTFIHWLDFHSVLCFKNSRTFVTFLFFIEYILIIIPPSSTLRLSSVPYPHNFKFLSSLKQKKYSNSPQNPKRQYQTITTTKFIKNQN